MEGENRNAAVGEDDRNASVGEDHSNAAVGEDDINNKSVEHNTQVVATREAPVIKLCSDHIHIGNQLSFKKFHKREGFSGSVTITKLSPAEDSNRHFLAPPGKSSMCMKENTPPIFLNKITENEKLLSCSETMSGEMKSSVLHPETDAYAVSGQDHFGPDYPPSMRSFVPRNIQSEADLHKSIPKFDFRLLLHEYENIIRKSSDEQSSHPPVSLGLRSRSPKKVNPLLLNTSIKCAQISPVSSSRTMSGQLNSSSIHSGSEDTISSRDLNRKSDSVPLMEFLTRNSERGKFSPDFSSRKMSRQLNTSALRSGSDEFICSRDLKQKSDSVPLLEFLTRNSNLTTISRKLNSSAVHSGSDEINSSTQDLNLGTDAVPLWEFLTRNSQHGKVSPRRFSPGFSSTSMPGQQQSSTIHSDSDNRDLNLEPGSSSIFGSDNPLSLNGLGYATNELQIHSPTSALHRPSSTSLPMKESSIKTDVGFSLSQASLRGNHDKIKPVNPPSSSTKTAYTINSASIPQSSSNLDQKYDSSPAANSPSSSSSPAPSR